MEPFIKRYQRFREKQIRKLAYQRYADRGYVNSYDKEDWYIEEKFWIVKYLLYLIRGNLPFTISLLTLLILFFQIQIESSNFVSLNRPFVEVRILDIKPDPLGRGEDASQVWCHMVYNIRNFGPVPAYNVHIEKRGLRIWSKNRGEFNEDDIPGLREFNIGWLAPNDETQFPRIMTYTDSKANMEAYNKREMPLLIEYKINYDGPKGLFWRRHYWYKCSAQYEGGSVQIINTKGN